MSEPTFDEAHIRNIRKLLHHEEPAVQQQGLALAKSLGDWSGVVQDCGLDDGDMVSISFDYRFDNWECGDDPPTRFVATGQIRRFDLNGAILELALTRPGFNASGVTKLSLFESYSLKDVDALASLTTLHELDLGDCWSLQNVDGLANLTALRRVNLTGCRSLQNLDGLANLTALEELGGRTRMMPINRWEDRSSYSSFINTGLAGCSALENLDGLANLKALKQLGLYQCSSLRNVDGLANLTALKELDLRNCTSLQNVDGLTNLPRLRVLHLSGCDSLQSVDGLANLPASCKVTGLTTS